MTVEAVSQIPPRRRDRLFAQVRKIVDEAEAIDRALEPMGEALAQDEALEEIAALFGSEFARSERIARREEPISA